MFYQWRKFSAEQVSTQFCVTCYNSRRIPQVSPLSGFRPEMCKYVSHCFAKCVMWMVWGQQAWSDNNKVCPTALSSELESWVSPVVRMSEKTLFPFCVAQGQNLTKALW